MIITTFIITTKPAITLVNKSRLLITYYANLHMYNFQNKFISIIIPIFGERDWATNKLYNLLNNNPYLSDSKVCALHHYGVK